jgi:atypical dual specificity phosphatase
MNTILSVRNFNASFAKTKVLVDLNFDLGDTGVTHLMGPCGTGKSVLLQSLAGISQRTTMFRSSGTIHYLGEPLGTISYPAYLEQKPAKLLNSVYENMVEELPERSRLTQQQQRKILERVILSYGMPSLIENLDEPLNELTLSQRRMALILSKLATSPPLLLLDEPTSAIPDKDTGELLDAISRIAQHRAVILIQHNQRQALELGGQTLLLAGGRIQEMNSTEELLTRPKSQAGKEFKGSGTCAVPSPNAKPEELNEEYLGRYQPVVPEPTPEPRLIPLGPKGFHWINRNQLAGTPRPGLMEDLMFDLEALRKVKIDHLVSLEETPTVPEAEASAVGISIRHLPINDMQPPESMDNTLELLRDMQQRIDNGQRIAVHCKGGLGRTGTILAAYLILTGMDVQQSISKVRCADQRMIQSVEQEAFLNDFKNWLVQASQSGQPV